MNASFDLNKLSGSMLLITILSIFVLNIEAETSKTDDRKLAAEKVRKIIEEIAPKSFPEVKLKK